MITPRSLAATGLVLATALAAPAHAESYTLANPFLAAAGSPMASRLPEDLVVHYKAPEFAAGLCSPTAIGPVIYLGGQLAPNQDIGQVVRYTGLGLSALGLLTAGAGHFYTGEWGKGLLYTLATPVALVGGFYAGYVLAPGHSLTSIDFGGADVGMAVGEMLLGILSATDAYYSANRLNRAAATEGRLVP